jgi:hypothetical protein
MALDSSDMADLTEAISKGIRRGFDDYFSSGRGAGRGRRGGIDESPPPPRMPCQYQNLKLTHKQM